MASLVLIFLEKLWKNGAELVAWDAMGQNQNIWQSEVNPTEIWYFHRFWPTKVAQKGLLWPNRESSPTEVPVWHPLWSSRSRLRRQRPLMRCTGPDGWKEWPHQQRRLEFLRTLKRPKTDFGDLDEAKTLKSAVPSTGLEIRPMDVPWSKPGKGKPEWSPERCWNWGLEPPEMVNVPFGLRHHVGTMP